MLKKANRLNSKFHFKVVRKYGTKDWYEYFQTTFVKPTNYIGPTKIGFIVSNQIHKSAAKRNKIKRILRELFRQNLAALPNDYWIVVTANSKILNKTYEEISYQVNRFIQKISIPH